MHTISSRDEFEFTALFNKKLNRKDLKTVLELVKLFEIKKWAEEYSVPILRKVQCVFGEIYCQK
jgi:hypothetical protein